jgi:hypothetical protein
LDTVALFASLLLLPLAPEILGGIKTTKDWQKGGEQWFQLSAQIAAEKPKIPPPNDEIHEDDKQQEGKPPQGHQRKHEGRGE